MDDLSGLRVIVAGGGAVGSAAALRLLRGGADVMLADPAARGDNASGIAAGMLAPVFETLLDPVSADHFDLLAAARDAWPALADSLDCSGAVLDRSGALFVAPNDQSMGSMADRMRGLDPVCQALEPAQARSIAPGLKASGPCLFTDGDWRLDAAGMLAALHQAFRREGGRIISRAVAGWSGTVATTDAGEALGADMLVLATGAAPAPWIKSEALGGLAPIKGQILRFSGAAPRAGPVVRAAGVYIAPSQGGAIVGATMQPGRADRRIEDEAVAGLQRAAVDLFPALEGLRSNAAAGVRASTPDGLPLVGPAETKGVMLAVGARRNGWLLAPIMAETLAARMGGGSLGPFGAAFDPMRFVGAL